MITETLKRAGVNPTRQSLMEAAESFNRYEIARLVNGVTVLTSKTNHYPVRAVQLMKAQGGKFVNLVEAVSAA